MRSYPPLAYRLLATMLAASTAPAQAALLYQLRYDAEDETMRAQLCGAEASAERRFVLDRGAQQFISSVERSSGIPLRADGNVWTARDWRADECLRWNAALGRIADSQKEDIGWRVHATQGDDDLVVAPQSWLLNTEHDGDAQAEVTLPPGVSFSAPWPSSRESPLRFSIPSTPNNWAANLAVGRFARREIAAGQGVLHLAMTGVRDAATQDKLARWMQQVAHAALAAYGQLPQSQVQVLTLPSRRGQAVSFGQSSRGQGHGLMLLIDPSRPLEEFSQDWKAVHEFAHLFHPYLGDEGRWLAEGLATYWQNVLRARAGSLSHLQAWEELHDGFERGRAQTRGARTLGQASGAMMREHAFLRTYWAGAAYWLAVDVELRRASDGRLSVEQALRRFRDCCFTPPREWSPAAFVSKLDSLLGTNVFAPRWREADAQTHFPDLATYYAELGLVVAADGKIHVDDSAPSASIRRTILLPPF